MRQRLFEHYSVYSGNLTGVYIDRFNKVWNHGACRKAEAINSTTLYVVF